MTDWMGGYMHRDRQLFARDLGEAVAALVRQRWPHHTAKQVEKAWGVDKSTAANVVRGHVSATTITKAVRAEGWSLLLALGAELTGETHHEWEEKRLSAIIERAERDREKVRRLRQKSALLRDRADSLAAAFHRQDADAGQRQVP